MAPQPRQRSIAIKALAAAGSKSIAGATSAMPPSDAMDAIRTGVFPPLHADPADRAAILDGARALQRVPELIGFGPHLLATAILPVTR
jgi:hypothetical protein